MAGLKGGKGSNKSGSLFIDKVKDWAFIGIGSRWRLYRGWGGGKLKVEK